MPPKLPKCCECQGTESLLWRPSEQGQICQECYEQKTVKEAKETQAEDEKSKEIKEEPKESTEAAKPAAAGEERHSKNLRKSTRATRFKSKNSTANAANANGSNSTIGTKSQSKRSRRSIFKKTPFKAPSLQASTRYSESVFYKGSYMQIGDIVSLVDREGNVYYAQIRGLLVDAYCEKSAFLSWLIPTQESPDPRERFDPASYLLGYDEDFPRKLNFLQFVMHAPSNYYYDRTQPFPLPDEMDQEPRRGGYIWTRLPGWERQRT